MFSTPLLTVVDALSAKPPALSSVFFWGIGVSSPVKLPLPSSDTQVTQVSTGRTQKAAVTKNGRLFVWEVIWYHMVNISTIIYIYPISQYQYTQSISVLVK